MEPKELVWTDEHVDRFWAYQGRDPSVYFTAKFGHRILARVRKQLRGNPRILDYGCGSGALIYHLLSRGYRVAGTDFSTVSVEKVRARFAHESLFLGAMTLGELVASSGSYDTVFLVEVVEHLNDKHLETTLRRVFNTLSPGGILIVTTPNDEQLDQNTVYCPSCNSTFHVMQHMRSWTGESLSRSLREHGFSILETAETDFSIDPRSSLGWYVMNRLFYLLRKRVPPHLMCVARRPV